MNVQKIADLDLSKHPLYSLVRAEGSYSLYTGGMDSHLLRVDLNNLGSILRQNPLLDQDPEFQKISGLQTSIYTLLEDPLKEKIWLGGGSGILQNLDQKTQTFHYSLNLGKSPIYSLAYISENLWIGLGNGQIVLLKKEIIQELNMGLDPKLVKIPENSFAISKEALRVIALKPDQSQLAISGKDSQIRILNPDSLDVQFTLEGHSFPVFSLAYSIDGKYLLSGSRDASIKIWNAENYKLIHTIPAHLFAINHILYHPNRPYFLTASMDKSIKVWGSDDFKLYKILNAEKTGGHISSVNRLAWVGHSDPILVSISDDRRMIFWDFEF